MFQRGHPIVHAYQPWTSLLVTSVPHQHWVFSVYRILYVRINLCVVFTWFYYRIIWWNSLYFVDGFSDMIADHFKKLSQCFISFSEHHSIPGDPKQSWVHLCIMPLPRATITSPGASLSSFTILTRQWLCVQSEQPCIITHQLHKTLSPFIRSFIGPGLCTDLYTPL